MVLDFEQTWRPPGETPWVERRGVFYLEYVLWRSGDSCVLRSTQYTASIRVFTVCDDVNLRMRMPDKAVNTHGDPRLYTPVI